MTFKIWSKDYYGILLKYSHANLYYQSCILPLYVIIEKVRN